MSSDALTGQLMRAAMGKAQRRWSEVLWELTPELRPALSASPKEAQCRVQGRWLRVDIDLHFRLIDCVHIEGFAWCSPLEAVAIVRGLTERQAAAQVISWVRRHPVPTR